MVISTPSSSNLLISIYPTTSSEDLELRFNTFETTSSSFLNRVGAADAADPGGGGAHCRSLVDDEDPSYKDDNYIV